MGGLLLGPALSYHLDRSRDFNEVNPGLGYMTPGGWGAYLYQNSYGKPSFMAGKELRKPLTSSLDAALLLGAVTGYPKSDVLPVVMPGLLGKLGGGHELGLMFQPPAGKATKGALTLQYRKQLKD